jgi:hypothetical protein
MTHDELLVKVDSVFYEDEGGTQLDLAGFNNQYRAIRAVVELHHPVEAEYFDNPVCAACSPDIDTWFDYPCQTIQAIEKELS